MLDGFKFNTKKWFMKNSNFLLRPNLPAYVMIVPAFLLFYNQLIAQYYYIPDQNFLLSGDANTCHGKTTELNSSTYNGNQPSTSQTLAHCSPNLGIINVCPNNNDYVKRPFKKIDNCSDCNGNKILTTNVTSNINLIQSNISDFNEKSYDPLNEVTVQVIVQKLPNGGSTSPPQEIKCSLYCFSDSNPLTYSKLTEFEVPINNSTGWKISNNNDKAAFFFNTNDYIIFRFRTKITNPNLIAIVQEKSTNGSWPDSPSSQFSAINSVTDLENYVRNNSNVAWKKLQNPPNCISIPQPETEPENVKFEVANFFKKLCERPGANFTVCVGKILAKNIPDIKKYVDFSLDISDVPKEKLPFIQNLVRMNEGRLQYDASQALISMKWSSPQDAITIPADILDAISPSNLNLQVKSRQKLPCEYLSYSFSLEQWQINPDTKKESLIDSQEVVFFSDPRDIKDCRCQLFWRRLLDIFRPKRPNGLKKG
jgi:hypothetical protein